MCSVAVLPSRDVWGELISVLAAVAAQVALEGVSEAVAAHVDGVHDVVQEEHAAVFAAVGPHLLPVWRHHLEALGGHLHAGGPDGLVLPLHLILHQHAVPPPRGDVVGEVDEARGGPPRAVLVVALGVRGVLAVAGRAVLLAGRWFGFGEEQQVLSGAVFGWQVVTGPHVALGPRLVERVQGAEAHIGRGGRGGLHQGPQRLGPQVADGAVDGLVDDMGLDQLAWTPVVGEVRQTLVPWGPRKRKENRVSFIIYFYFIIWCWGCSSLAEFGNDSLLYFFLFSF